MKIIIIFFFQAEDGIRDLVRSRGLGDVYKRQRQLGAYFILRLQESKPTNWDEKKASFRNNVVHKGYIPSSEEAIEYGQYVLTFIRSMLKELNDTSKEFLDKATFIHLSKNGDKFSDKIRISNGSIPVSYTHLTLPTSDLV